MLLPPVYSSVPRRGDALQAKIVEVLSHGGYHTLTHIYGRLFQAQSIYKRQKLKIVYVLGRHVEINRREESSS
jgi:hypothetical protein